MRVIDLAAQIAAFGRAIAATPDTGEVATFKCLKCEDQEWVYFTKQIRGRPYQFAERCRCLTKGGWALDNFGFPPTVARLPLKASEAQSWVNTHTPGDTVHLVGHPKRTLEAGLSMVTEMSKSGYAPRYFSARDMDVCPQSFLTAPVVAVGEVDGGLGAPRAKVLADALRDAEGTIVVMGTSPQKWPRWDSFAMLNIALRARDAREIKI